VAHANIVALDDAGEDREGSFWLIERHCVTSIKDPREGKIAVLAHMAAYVGVIDDYVGVASGREDVTVVRK
jgi:hypothetical protein